MLACPAQRNARESDAAKLLGHIAMARSDSGTRLVCRRCYSAPVAAELERKRLHAGCPRILARTDAFNGLGASAHAARMPLLLRVLVWIRRADSDCRPEPATLHTVDGAWRRRAKRLGEWSPARHARSPLETVNANRPTLLRCKKRCAALNPPLAPPSSHSGRRTLQQLRPKRCPPTTTSVGPAAARWLSLPIRPGW